MPRPATLAPTFPANFTWGAAASSYQIEGGSSPQERGESVWDMFFRKPGAVYQGHTGAQACDHVNRYDEDVQLMADLGLHAYRLSISWPRVLRDGVGAPHAPGLDFYDRLIDTLLAHNITPWVTLFHWDFPYSLYLRGGWLNRDSADWFADYTTLITQRLSDRVSYWMTVNEPQVFCALGHADAVHAPGIKLRLREQLTVAHNVLRAHGRAVQAIRAGARQPATIGWAPVGHVSYPIDADPINIDAARAATFSITKPDLWNNTWFSDPVCLGRYPEDGLRLFAPDLPNFPNSDLADIHQPLDFYGLNIYHGVPVRASSPGAPQPAVAIPHEPGNPRNSLNWAITPDALRYGPRFIHERYRLPIVITENGMADIDWVDLDGNIHDFKRIDYTRRYLLALRQSIADGADVRGYFHWSLLDNFEWAEGYKERFGLVHVDFATQKRTLKHSAHWYKSIIQSNGARLVGSSGPLPAAGRAGEEFAHDPTVHLP